MKMQMRKFVKITSVVFILILFLFVGFLIIFHIYGTDLFGEMPHPVSEEEFPGQLKESKELPRN